MYIHIKDIPRIDLKRSVTLKGWIYNLRSSGKIHFLQMRDGTGFIQIIVDKGQVSEKVFNDCKKISIETSVEVTGTIKKDKRSPDGYEMHLQNVILIHKASEYLIQKKDHGIKFLLDNRHLWLRSKKQWAIMRIRNTVINAIYEYLNKEGFIKIDAPIFTPTACEGTTTLFEVPYTPAWKDGKKEGPVVYLSQSGQLYIEAAIYSHGKVFDFGPTFRAEKSKTRRHLTEFWMMDAEAAFVEHKENMQIQENLTKFILKKVLKENVYELTILNRDINCLKPSLNTKFPVITHKEAIVKLKKKGIKIGFKDDLGADEDTMLSKQYNTPFFVEKFPKEIKPFYMKENPEDKTTYLNNDMYAPEGYGELIGGSQREDDYNKLLKNMKENNIPIHDYKWYLDLRKYGSVPHSGFGIGLERFVSWICGLKHLRTAIPFPRTINRISP